VVSNGCDINDRRFQLTLDFSILSPDHDRQMAVVVALMNGIRRRDQNNVLSHPLLETYLRAKWDKMKAFFFALFFVHLLFVVALSTHVILNLNKHDESAVRNYKPNASIHNCMILRLCSFLFSENSYPEKFRSGSQHIAPNSYP